MLFQEDTGTDYWGLRPSFVNAMGRQMRVGIRMGRSSEDSSGPSTSEMPSLERISHSDRELFLRPFEDGGGSEQEPAATLPDPKAGGQGKDAAPLWCIPTS